MTTIIRGLQVASVRTGLGRVTLRLAEREILVAHVGIMAVAVKGSVNGATEFGWAGVATDSWRRRVLIVRWSVQVVSSRFGLTYRSIS